MVNAQDLNDKMLFFTFEIVLYEIHPIKFSFKFIEIYFCSELIQKAPNNRGEDTCS
jgi:hypothetical protein